MDLAKAHEWWRGTATHMWSAYFNVRGKPDEYDSLSQVRKRQYDICETVYITRFGQVDQELLRMYYSRDWKWGDDRYVVEDYSARTGKSVDYIWRTIKLANRYVAEELGILDRKDMVQQ